MPPPRPLAAPAALFAALFLVTIPDLRGQDAGSSGGERPPEESIRYVLADGLITGAVVSAPGGTELRRETYVRDSSGRVVDILIRFPDGGTARAGGAGGRDWIEYPDGLRVYRSFLPSGALESEELSLGPDLLSRTTFRYAGDSLRPSIKEEYRPKEGWKRVTEFGARGLVEREVLTTPSGPAETSLYAWDDGDRLLEILIKAGRGERRIRFAYLQDGSETEERTDTTGALVLRVHRKPDGTSVEERFDGGVLFARTFLVDGRLVREEFYLDGRLVRLREAP